MKQEYDGAINFVRNRYRRNHILKALLLICGVLSGGLVALFILDNFLHLGSTIRIILEAGLFVGLLAVVVRFLLTPLLALISREEAAILIERSFPEVDNRLINTERLAKDQQTPDMILSLLRTETGQMVKSIDLDRVISIKKLKPSIIVAGIAVGLFIIYAIILPNYFINALKRYAMPGAFIPPITRTNIFVTPGNATIIEGANLAIEVKVNGEIPSSARIVVGQTSYDMLFSGTQFIYEFKSIETPFGYFVQAGDAQSDTFQVNIIRRSKIQNFKIAYTYPDYLKMPPRVEDVANGNIAAVEGTRIELAPISFILVSFPPMMKA